MKKIVLFLISILMLTSCGDDEKNEKGNADVDAALVGTWTADLSEDGVSYFEEMAIKSDGTFQTTSRITWLDPTEIEENGYTNGEVILTGKYSTSNNIIMMTVLKQRFKVDDGDWNEEAYTDGDYILSYGYVLDKNQLTLVNKNGGSGIYVRKNK